MARVGHNCVIWYNPSLARARQRRRAIGDETDDEARPELEQDAGVDVVQREVDAGKLQVRVVRERGHRAVGVAER